MAVEDEASLHPGVYAKIISIGVVVAVCSIAFPWLLPGLLAMLSSASVSIANVTAVPRTGSLLTSGVVVGNRLTDALALIEQERESLVAERDAFQEFGDSVQSMEAPDEPHPSNLSANRLTSTGSAQLRPVRERYRDTVMATPDFDDIYGESLAEHMATEFSEELATAVVEGELFTPSLKYLLVTRARAAGEQRTELIAALDREHASVANVRSTLAEHAGSHELTVDVELYQRPFPELIEYEQDLREQEQRCEQLLQERQRDIHRENTQFSRSDQLSLQEYLYEPLDVSFPALTAILDTLTQIRDNRRKITRTIATRY